MSLVEALDREPGVRAVLGLHENVCTGAADGYGRITGEPAMTLLHLGPGLANGLANLHNARRANTPVVNVVGDHASGHLAYDSPLTSDIGAIAGAVGTVTRVRSRADLAAGTVAAIEQARSLRGVSTLIVPADHQQEQDVDRPVDRPAARSRSRVPDERLELAAKVVTRAGPRTIFLLGGNALTTAGQRAAARVAARLGAKIYCETFPAVAERGGGLPPLDRLPYFPEVAVRALADAEAVVTVGARVPVAYFGYPGIPSTLAPPGTVHPLAEPHEDAAAAITELADLLTAPATRLPDAAPVAGPADDAALTGESVARVLAAELPERAIVSMGGGTVGSPFSTAGAGAAAHTVMTNTGGAIGQGLPCALGAAIAAPDRPVV